MTMTDVFFSKAERFSIGVEMESGRYYVSFPVMCGFAEYEDYYEIDQGQFEQFQRDTAAASAFVTACRRGEKGELLFFR